MPVGMAARQTQAENPACGSRKALKIKSLSRETQPGTDVRPTQGNANAATALTRIKCSGRALRHHPGIPTAPALFHGHDAL